MIRSVCFHKDGSQVRNLTPEGMRSALAEPQSLLWVSLECPSDLEVQNTLNDVFHFHPLAIEDCLSTGYQTPKIDDFGEYLFIVVHAVEEHQDFAELETRELDLFLGKNYLITIFRDDGTSPLDSMWKRIERDERLHQFGADFLCHAVLDEVVDEYLPLIDKMEEEIDQLEDRVLARPEPQTLSRILDLKHAIMSLRRIISPQREVMNRLSRDDFRLIDRQSRIYFRDIYDHLVRIQDMTEALRDIIGGDLDIYLNSTSLRLNEVMKALTIVSTIFLPLSFVAGVYGMNFQHMPELSKTWGYPMAWGIFVLIVVGMVTFFKKRKWF